MLKRFICLFCYLLISTNAIAQLALRNYTTNDGLTHNLCYQLLDGNDGYIYIGTDNGLAKFNGSKFERVALGANDNQYVIDIKKDVQNNIYLATWGNGIQWLNANGKVQPLNKYDSLSRYSRCFLQKNIVIGYDGFYDFKYYNKDNPAEVNKFIFCVRNEHLDLKKTGTAKQKDELLVGQAEINNCNNEILIYSVPGSTYFKGIYKFENDKLTQCFSFLENEYVYSLQSVADGYTAFTNNAIIFFNSQGITSIIPRDTRKIKKYFCTPNCIAIVEKTLAGDRVIIKNNKLNSEIEITNTQLNNALVSDIMLTNNNTLLWISTYGSGIFKLNLAEQGFSHKGFKGSNIVNSLILNNENYYATNTELFCTDKQLKVRKKIASQLINNLYYDSTLNLVAVRNASSIKQAIKLGSKTVAINGSSSQLFNFGTIYYRLGVSSIVQINGKKQKQINFEDSANDFALRINKIIGFENKIIVGSNKGIYFVDTLTLKVEPKFQHYNGIFSNEIASVAVNKEGLWFINKSQLVQYKNDELKIFNYTNPINDFITDLFISNNGTIWLTTQKGFALFDKGLFKTFTKKEGFNADFTNCFYNIDSNNLIACTNNGLIQINESLIKNIEPPSIILNNSYGTTDSIFNLLPNDSFYIKANIKNFTESDVFLEVKINDNEWKPYDNNKINFKDYQVGNYTIQFRARYLNSDYTYSKAIRVSKNNYWFARPISIALWFLLGATVIWGIMRWRLINVRKKSKQLKQLIDQNEALQLRMADMRKEMAQDFHDELGNKIAGITMLSAKMLDSNEQMDKANISIIERINKDSKTLYSTVRDYIWAIDSNNNQLLSLINSISDFGNELFSLSTTKFQIIKFGNEANIVVPALWSRQILLIFKEALTNTYKHAYANNVSISYKMQDGKLHMQLTDDGRGYTEKTITRKNGLNNMVYRASRIHATIDVSSSSAGTIIVFITDVIV
jgi:signal transduction histidine kinase